MGGYLIWLSNCVWITCWIFKSIPGKDQSPSIPAEMLLCCTSVCFRCLSAQVNRLSSSVNSHSSLSHFHILILRCSAVLKVRRHVL